MALKPITLGLRRFVNDSTEITRIDVRVAPGAEIEVDDDVAAQLPAAFKDPEVVGARDKARASAGRKAAKAKVDDEAEPVE